MAAAPSHADRRPDRRSAMPAPAAGPVPGHPAPSGTGASQTVPSLPSSVTSRTRSGPATAVTSLSAVDGTAAGADTLRQERPPSVDSHNACVAPSLVTANRPEPVAVSPRTRSTPLPAEAPNRATARQ